MAGLCWGVDDDGEAGEDCGYVVLFEDDGFGDRGECDVCVIINGVSFSLGLHHDSKAQYHSFSY